MKIKLYNGDDFFYDHPVITTAFVLFLITMGIVILVLGIHICTKAEKTHEVNMRIIETEEKARICQETGYCNSSNINIDYKKGQENEQ